MWPFKPKTETRAGYADALIQTLIASADGESAAKVAATGAMEAVCGLVGRAFASAEVSAPAPVSAALTPAVVGHIGRSLVKHGDLVMAIEATGEALRFVAVESYDVLGDHDPASWRYRVTLSGPSAMVTRSDVSADEIAHFRYSYDSARPWAGIGPMQVASLTGRLSANVASALADEAGTTRGFLLPVPRKDGDDATLSALKGDLKSLRGGLNLVESMTEQWSAQSGMGSRSADSKQWEPRRVGASPPPALVALAEQAAREVFSACGISPALFGGADGTAAREAWRQALFGVIAPLGRMVSSELSAKFGEEVKLDWQELRASDLSGRARAFAGMVQAGMDLEKAAALSGLLLDEAA